MGCDWIEREGGDNWKFRVWKDSKAVAKIGLYFLGSLVGYIKVGCYSFLHIVGHIFVE